MIEAFSLRNAHEFGDALASQARLRYRVFVLDRALPHHFYDGMEFDEFDTPAAVYLVWRDPDLTVRGLIRMVPTSVPYMLKSYWPFLCETQAPPDSERIWEASRICVDRRYRGSDRAKIMPEMLCGVREFCELNEASAVVGVTRKHLISHFLRSGLEWMGESREIEGQQEAAMLVRTEDIRPVVHCEKYGIHDQVLSLQAIEQQKIAA